MPALPTGTFTFLFTDVEGSTRIVQHLGDTVSNRVFADHRRLLMEAVHSADGRVYQDQGESFVFVFPRAKDAVRAAVTAQRSFRDYTWPDGGQVLVRMGLHTGEPVGDAGEYVGLDVHRAARICEVGHGAQILVSLTTRELVADDAPVGVTFRDLGEHRLKDLARPHRLFQIVAADLAADFPPLKSLDLFPNNLPRQLTNFFGREEQIAEVRRLLSITPLLTLTGVGGVGKTRLALQVAAEVLEEFKDGVWLVELAPLSDSSLVPQSVATNLGVREQPGRSIQKVISEFLKPKELLLVLDNAEHLITACAHLADALLRVCPKLRIMITSRERLGITGETVWPVPALSFPDTLQPRPVEQFMESDAIRLFVARGTAVVPTFKLTDRGGLAVARICQLLDGLPLAIELAAAKVKVLSVEQIADRLNDRFRLLTGGSRTTLPRYQALQTTMDWSYDLLSEKEQSLLRRLSVFAGGWTLEAVQAICVGDEFEASDTLDLLSQLVDKSLVIAETQGVEARYRFLETIREYARDRLLESGETGIRTRHRDWYLQLAEKAARESQKPSEREWLERLDLEHDNLRAALQWSATAADHEARLRLVVYLARFWNLRGYLSAGRTALTEALSSVGNSSPRLRARALYWRGAMARSQGDDATARESSAQSLAISREIGDGYGVANTTRALGAIALSQGEHGAARSYFSEALRLFRDLGHKWGVAMSLHALGRVAFTQGDWEDASMLLEESLMIHRQMGNKWGIAWSLRSLGDLAVQKGEAAAGKRLYEESLTIFREFGDKDGISRTLHGLGNVARLQGAYAEAEGLHTESLGILRELGDKAKAGWALRALGILATQQGDPARAAALYREALTLLWEAKDNRGIIACLIAYASLACRQQQSLRATKLYASAKAVRETLGIPMPLSPFDSKHEDNIVTLRHVLGERAFEALWAEGRAMTPEQAVEYALSE